MYWWGSGTDGPCFAGVAWYHPRPETLDPLFETLNPGPQTENLEQQALHPKPYTGTSLKSPHPRIAIGP